MCVIRQKSGTTLAWNLVRTISDLNIFRVTWLLITFAHIQDSIESEKNYPFQVRSQSVCQDTCTSSLEIQIFVSQRDFSGIDTQLCMLLCQVREQLTSTAVFMLH